MIVLLHTRERHSLFENIYNLAGVARQGHLIWCALGFVVGGRLAVIVEVHIAAVPIYHEVFL